MLKRALPILSAAMVLTAPALAATGTEKEAWTVTSDALRAESAGISLPQTVSTLSLSKSGEASHGGKGIDNYAQYLSEDGAIQATFYVYMPSHADASLAAHMTDRAIMERFGSRTHRTAYAAVPVAGIAQGAIRAVYDDAAEGALTTAAGFVHAGRWMVKLRITGPTERRAEILAGLDGMLGALRFDQQTHVQATVPAKFAACPSHDGSDARLTRTNASWAVAVPLPAEGRVAMCIRGLVQTDDGKFEILQQRGVTGGSVIVPVDDSGTLLAFDPAASGKGYQMSMHSVGQTDLYGVYDRVPTERQIAAILDGSDPQTVQAQRTADYAANGAVTMRAADANR